MSLKHHKLLHQKCNGSDVRKSRQTGAGKYACDSEAGVPLPAVDAKGNRVSTRSSVSILLQTYSTSETQTEKILEVIPASQNIPVL